MKLRDFKPSPAPVASRTEWQNRASMAVLDVVERELRRTGRSPTRKVVTEELGLTSRSGVQKHLQSLERGGLVELGDRGAVTITRFGALSLSLFRSKGGAG